MCCYALDFSRARRLLLARAAAPADVWGAADGVSGDLEEAAFALVLADVIGALTELRACAPVTGAVGVLNELRAVVGRAEDGAAAYAPTVTVRPTYSDHSALRPGQTPTPAPSRVSTPQPTPPTEPTDEEAARDLDNT